MMLLLCYDNEGVYVNTYGRVTRNVLLQVCYKFYYNLLKVVFHVGEANVEQILAVALHVILKYCACTYS